MREAGSLGCSLAQGAGGHPLAMTPRLICQISQTHSYTQTRPPTSSPLPP